MPVNFTPDGYHAATPYLIINGAAAAIEFYKKAFGATELFRLEAPGGSDQHEPRFRLSIMGGLG